MSASLEQYHRKKAIEYKVIEEERDSYPLKYKKGTHYKEGLYKIRKRRQSSYFVIPEARVHFGNGSSYRVSVLKEGGLHELKDNKETIRLFPRNPKGRGREKHFTVKFSLPPEIIGYEGAAATLVFYPNPDTEAHGGRLEISPPELRLPLQQLCERDGATALRAACEYIELLLQKNWWKFGEVIFKEEEVHYAFSSEIVDLYLPGLMDNPAVHVLFPEDKESDYQLFRDKSVPEGELETTHASVARQLLTLLNYRYREAMEKGNV